MCLYTHCLLYYWCIISCIYRRITTNQHGNNSNITIQLYSYVQIGVFLREINRNLIPYNWLSDSEYQRNSLHFRINVVKQTPFLMDEHKYLENLRIFGFLPKILRNRSDPSCILFGLFHVVFNLENSNRIFVRECNEFYDKIKSIYFWGRRQRYYRSYSNSYFI